MRLMLSHKSLLALTMVVAACGPAARDRGGDDDDGGPDANPGACVPTAEVCGDGIDNDCDQRLDCSDVDCSGIGDCPVCGAVENPEVTPLALPDGVSSGTTCSVDADCSGATPNCVAKECHASYVSTLNFVGFPAGATLTDPNKLLKVCVNMEHSWLRDLQIELLTPSGAVFILDKWYDRETVEEIYLGAANDTDDDGTPVPGTGLQYCWTATATNKMIDETTGVSAPLQSVGGTDTMPAGDYKPNAPWTALTNTTLNGMWSMRVTDLWEIDNGFLFSWSISFDPSLVSDCAGPIIL